MNRGPAIRRFLHWLTMSRDELVALWAVIESHLKKARAMLPATANHNPKIEEYQDFLDHNELELACDMLEDYAEEHSVSPDFWLSLGDAAEAMKLHDRAKHYRVRSTAGL